MAATHLSKAKRIFKKPYNRVFTFEKDGTVSASVLEFVGCYTFGKTLEEANSYLQEAAECWVAACLSMKQFVPGPIRDFYGVQKKLGMK
ncbi:MAG: type II toxin-antitoxin system HicB family antitoxin [Candidatus Paceibacterota bacterium]